MDFPTCTTIIFLPRRLGQYRMPFCWTAIELAKIVRGIPLSQVTGSVTVLVIDDIVTFFVIVIFIVNVITIIETYT